MTAFYARVVDSLVVETCDAAALATHHPDLAATFIACPIEVQPNWHFNAPDAWIDPDGKALKTTKKKGRD